MVQTAGKIVKIIDETPDVKTFRIKSDEAIDFIPGQYCLLSVVGKKDFQGIRKPLAFSNIPNADNIIEITVKKMGNFTSMMFLLQPGDAIEIDGPKGKSMIFDESVKDDIVFIAGGSGITPFMSAIRYVVAKGMKNQIILLFSNRKESEIIYKKELDEISTKCDNIKVIYTLTDNQGESWKGESSRIDKALILKYVNNAKDKIWYLCGPAAMVMAMRHALVEISVPKEKVKFDSWQMPGKHDKEPGN